jgi:hypothetical protein
LAIAKCRRISVLDEFIPTLPRFEIKVARTNLWVAEICNYNADASRRQAAVTTGVFVFVLLAGLH